MSNTIDFDKLIIDGIDTVTAIDKTDGSIILQLDQLKDGTLENGTEIVYGTGKASTRISALEKNKTSKFSCNNGYVVTSALAAQVGGEVESASADNKFAIPAFEYIEVKDATKVTLSEKPVGITGKEIPFIYKTNRDKTTGEKFPIGATASATDFALDPDTKEITLPTGVFKVGDIVAVRYEYESETAKKVINKSDNFSKNAKVIIDAVVRDTCDQSTVYHAIFVYPNAKIDGNFSLAFGSEPVAQAFAAEALQDVCSLDKELWTFFVV